MKIIYSSILTFVAASSFLVSDPASAWTNEDFRIAGKQVQVYLYDSVADGCWTNLGEVRRYAEDKLSNAGAVVKKDVGVLYLDSTYEYAISVIGYRLPNGICIGSIETELRTTVLQEKFHVAYVHNVAGLFSGPGNLNDNVLDFVGNSIRQIR